MSVVACYSSYLVISVALTVWVARTLYRSGRVFLLDAFRGNEELADSVNRLLVVGFSSSMSATSRSRLRPQAPWRQ